MRTRFSIIFLFATVSVLLVAIMHPSLAQADEATPPPESEQTEVPPEPEATAEPEEPAEEQAQEEASGGLDLPEIVRASGIR